MIRTFLIKQTFIENKYVLEFSFKFYFSLTHFPEQTISATGFPLLSSD